MFVTKRVSFFAFSQKRTSGRCKTYGPFSTYLASLICTRLKCTRMNKMYQNKINQQIVLYIAHLLLDT